MGWVVTSAALVDVAWRHTGVLDWLRAEFPGVTSMEVRANSLLEAPGFCS